MFAARLVRNLRVRTAAVAVRNMGGHHGPMMPPFVRIRPPSATVFSLISNSELYL